MADEVLQQLTGAIARLDNGVVGLKPPDTLQELNAEQFKKWAQSFEIYRVASGSDKSPEEVQIALLLHCMGRVCIDIYDTFTLTEEEGKSYKAVLEKFMNHFIPLKNESVNSHLFFTRNQSEGEAFDTYLTELKRLSKDCEFGELRDRLIRDRIVAGIGNKKLKDRLLRELDLTLQKTVQICKAAELASEQVKKMDGQAEVQMIQKKPDNKAGNGHGQEKKSNTGGTRQNFSGNSSNWRPQNRYKMWRPQNNASKNGLGSIILQDEKPVAYGSRSLTETEKNYSQIEKESLAILYGSRLQKIRLAILPYSVELKYKPGKELVIADDLSRSYLNDTSQTYDLGIEAHVAMIDESFNITDNKVREIRDETSKDEELKTVREYIKNGWPNNKYDVNNNAKGPMICKEVPNGPWEIVFADIFFLYGNPYILIVDAYSKYVEIKQLRNLSAGCTINNMKEIFARHGVPEEVYSDSGTQFTSREFQIFAREWNSVHKIISPKHHIGNGNIPVSTDGKTPAELLYNRKVKNVIPNWRADGNYNKEEFRNELLRRQQKQRDYFDKHSKRLPELKRGEVVQIQNENNQKPHKSGVIINRDENPRAYQIKDEHGEVLKRNRKMLIRGGHYNEPDEYLEEDSEGNVDNQNQGENDNSNAINQNNNSAANEQERPGVSSRAQGTNYCTRSGREVKKPAYLKDYV
ncbi:uncharacterized protein LOC107044027 [Diachasma alloeum]|uniref:uncharacterized protein LOC107044027 n=1 Tax=Diachasma alloeum TaxID=454923 RepID=UPI0007384309|nr:uncharacterized protein LOC107044027 [Diachasma alloeum]